MKRKSKNRVTTKNFMQNYAKLYVGQLILSQQKNFIAVLCVLEQSAFLYKIKLQRAMWIRVNQDFIQVRKIIFKKISTIFSNESIAFE